MDKPGTHNGDNSPHSHALTLTLTHESLLGSPGGSQRPPGFLIHEVVEHLQLPLQLLRLRLLQFCKKTH